MASQAVQRSFHLGNVGRIHDVRNRVAIHRVPQVVLQEQYRNLLEIVFRQLDLAAEDRNQMFALQLLWLGVRTVALQAQLVGFGHAQQMLVVAAMRFVTYGAALLEHGLVVDGFLG